MNALSEPLNHPDPVDILARTLWGEARGESKAGREAVARVVLNRVAHARAKGGRFWWGGDIFSVCLKPWQFSCWNANDPNRAKLEAVQEGNKIFDQCLRIANPLSAASWRIRSTAPPITMSRACRRPGPRAANRWRNWAGMFSTRMLDEENDNG
ncbi:MAG: cell wall hydrolase [Rhodospirillales bacterium]|nr:cell wall hydrolase [Rhodospirillales bacterium]